MSAPEIHERAYAKVNLILRVGRRRPDGLHPVHSVFASLDLSDELFADRAGPAEDRVECPGVAGPNLAGAALTAYRRRVPALPALHLRIVKRIPVAAGLGGGSADAAAALRAANRIAGEPLDADALRVIAAGLGSDVPSQVEPRHAVVQGAGELVEPVELPPLAIVLAPQRLGLSTAEVYAQLDRIREGGGGLDAAALPALTTLEETAAALHNDLEPAALALRPELAEVLDSLRSAGAAGALVSGAGPTCFGLFPTRQAADAAAATIPNGLVAQLRCG